MHTRETRKALKVLCTPAQHRAIKTRAAQTGKTIIQLVLERIEDITESAAGGVAPKASSCGAGA
jgi:hypothetical protein